MHKVLAFLTREYKAALPPTVFFLVVFHVTAFTRGLMVESYGITPAGSALATVAAVILAKVILIFDRFAFVNLFASRPMVLGIIWKTLVFGLLGSIFQLLELWVPLLFKYQSATAASQHLRAELVWPRFWANHIVLLLWLLIYCIIGEMVRVLGAQRVRELFLGSPQVERRKSSPDAK